MGKLKHGSKMPQGKYKGYRMKDIPAKFLIYIFENNLCSWDVAVYIRDNMDALKKAGTNNLKTFLNI